MEHRSVDGLITNCQNTIREMLGVYTQCLTYDSGGPEEKVLSRLRLKSNYMA